MNRKPNWANHLFEFYMHLDPPAALPAGIEWLHPQKDPEVQNVLRIFLNKYYNDNSPRRLMFGINPGRYGAGVTGVNFTAPRQLTEDLDITHPFKMQSELSAEFIYKMINAYGGPRKFYKKHFISSVCPFGFIRSGKNINYYDDKNLLIKVEPFIIDAMQFLLKGNVLKDRCYSIGGEKNYRYLSSINEKYNWFGEIIPLPHPRFIMQYKRRQINNYLHLYTEKLKN